MAVDRMQLFDKARCTTEAVSKEFPQSPTFRTIVRQIDYLIELANGKTSDRSRLKDIILGVQAAREIEPLNLELAELLYEVAAEAKKM